mgnify:CR=1 FL=1
MDKELLLKYIAGKASQKEKEDKKHSRLFRNEDYCPYICHFFHIPTNDLH